jgi:phytoene dehydrogenase-like protein
MAPSKPLSKPPRQSIIIIGGGLGGLSTGCYAQMNGYRSQVFELHEIPGGCCTGWKRGDWVFDVCVSWMLGSGPGNELHQVWLELGALQGKQIRHFEMFNVVETTDGHTVKFYSDPDRLEAHLLEISPADARQIREFCRGMRRFQKCLTAYPFLVPVGLMGRFERLRMYARFIPYYRLIAGSITTLMTDYSARFKSPVLQEAFNFILYEKMPKFPVLPFYFQFACHAGRSAGVPEGGSLGLARSVEDRYRRLGGQIAYNARVEQVLVERDRAVGVRLSDGTERFADIIVSACDGYQTIMKFLGGKYLNDTYRRLYTQTINEPGMIFPGYFMVFLALDRQFPAIEHCTTHLLTTAEAAQLPGILHPSINVQLRSKQYPELQAPGTSVVLGSYFCDISAWRPLNEGEERVTRQRRGKDVHTLAVKRGARYAHEKKRIAQFFTDYLDRKYPGLAASVVLRDMSTPLTHVRYTGNYNGSSVQWMPFGEGGETLEKEINSHGPVLPGLSNFYMSGVWVTSGGLIRAAVAGRHVMYVICREDGKEFTAHIDDTAPLPTHVLVPGAPPRSQPTRDAPAPDAHGHMAAPAPADDMPAGTPGPSDHRHERHRASAGEPSP